MTNENSFNIEEFSKKSQQYYIEIRAKLESESEGKYVALDYESKQYWIGDTATEALSNAKKQFPDKLFYLKQVGSSTTFSIQSAKIQRHSKRSYVFTGAY